MNQALQMALLRRILSLHSNRRPLKDFHLGETILPLQTKETDQFENTLFVQMETGQKFNALLFPPFVKPGREGQTLYSVASESRPPVRDLSWF